MADDDQKVQEENTDIAETPVEETVEETVKSSESEANSAAEPTTEANESNEEVEVKPTISEQTGSASDASTTDEPAPKSKPVSKAVSKDLEKIIEQIEKLSVIELADLVHALEERFGVSASAPVAVAAGAPAAAGEVDEGKTTFNVILTSGGANKISVIKAVRELVQTLGLKEAKDLVEGAPKPVLEGVNKESAEEAKTKLTAAGGTVELQ